VLFSFARFRAELCSIEQLGTASLLRQLQRLFGLMEFTPVSRSYVSPSLFRQTLPSFFKSGFEQHDCSEFAKIVLDKIEQESKA